MDKILRIDMGADGGPAIRTEPLGDYAGLGGRAMTSAIVAKEVPPTCHPLGEQNKLIIAPGLLSGSAAAQSGRISVGCKSPLTGGIKEANSGGQGAQVLARLGYAAIVLEGKPGDDILYKVFINADGARIEADNSLKMLGNYALVDKMKAAYGGEDYLHLHRSGRRNENGCCHGGLYRHGAAPHPACRPRRCRGRDGGQRGQGHRPGRYRVQDAHSCRSAKIQGRQQGIRRRPEQTPCLRPGPACLRHQRSHRECSMKPGLTRPTIFPAAVSKASTRSAARP